MGLFNKTSENQLDMGLAILRVVIGAIFVAHGGQKMFVYGFDGVAASFGQMGIPMANILGPFVALVEFLGGLALVTGLLTRLAGLGLVGDMAVAILKVHLAAGFFAPKGYEFPLALLAGSLVLAITGAGRYSIDAQIGRKARIASQVGEKRLRRAA